MRRYQPRVVIGKRKGKKTRVTYPSMMQGYISHTFASKSEAKRHVKELNMFQRNRARIRDVS